MEIRTAERKKAKLRIGVSGPSGSGKTYSALQMARGLSTSWEKVLLIDTENGSGELYSHLGPYKIITLSAPFSPERYIEAIGAAEEAGMETIVIDSVSHEWDGSGGCLELNETIAKTKFRGNTWSAWSETTPRHQKFIHAIVSSPCHVITSARSKTDTVQVDDGSKKSVKKVGTKEIQREGFEFELTVNFALDRDGNLATASKDRTGLFSRRDPFTISEETGEELLAWNNSGKEVVIDYTKEKGRVIHNLTRLGFVLVGEPEEKRAKVSQIVFALTELDATVDKHLQAIVRKLEGYKSHETAQAVYAQYLSKQAGSAPEAAPAHAEEMPEISYDDVMVGEQPVETY